MMSYKRFAENIFRTFTHGQYKTSCIKEGIAIKQPQKVKNKKIIFILKQALLKVKVNFPK